MRASVGSGSVGTGLSLIGSALMGLFPNDRWIGWLVVLLGFAVILFDIQIDHGRMKAAGPNLSNRRWRTMWPQLLVMASIVGLAVGIWGWRQQPRDTAPGALTQNPKAKEREAKGFAAHLVVRLGDQQAPRRRYILSCAGEKKASVSLYISASNRFTMDLTDVNGESHSLAVVAGRKGVPVAEWVYLAAEAATLPTATHLSLRIDGELVAERTIPFSVELGDADWAAKCTIAADLQGKENGKLGLGEMLIRDFTLSADEREQFTHYVLKKWKLSEGGPPPPTTPPATSAIEAKESAPPADPRADIKRHLRAYYIQISDLLQRLPAAPDDDSFYKLADEMAELQRNEGTWVRDNMGNSALAKLRSSSGQSWSYQWPGEHAPEAIRSRNERIRTLIEMQENTEALIQSGDWDKDG